MRVLMLYAHPAPDSFCAAIRDAALASLARGGHTVDLCDLHAEGFDPVLSRAEREGYHDPAFDRSAVAPHIDRLKAAEALTVVSPVWNFGYPAILKGYFDRVWLPGVTFAMRNGRVAPGAIRLRRVAAMHTYGGPMLAALLAGDPTRRFTTRIMRRLFRPERRPLYFAHYGMNTATPATRAAYLARVAAAMERL